MVPLQPPPAEAAVGSLRLPPQQASAGVARRLHAALCLHAPQQHVAMTAVIASLTVKSWLDALGSFHLI